MQSPPQISTWWFSSIWCHSWPSASFDLVSRFWEIVFAESLDSQLEF
jgi:hypothetical protein